MLFPDKHISLAESLFGLGGFVLGTLGNPKTIDEIWMEFEIEYKAERYPAYHSFENFLITLGFLYSIAAIELENETLKRATS